VRIYMHWPFCRSRCAYCDFNTRVAGEESMKRYHSSLTEEMRAWSSWLPQEDMKVASLYIGGGTPSLISGEGLGALYREAARRFHMMPGAEITVEVNPATWSRKDFREAAWSGINRFSIGVQSLDHDLLRLLGRPHNAEEALRSVQYAQDAGEVVISVDLLYALPGESKGALLTTLDRLLELRPHHISIYALTVEEKTPLALMHDRGVINLPDEDNASDQYFNALEKLESGGYLQYEISNFSLPGYRCQHNLAYWRREQYLGLGAGAHSFLGDCRFYNVRSVLDYTKRIQQGLSPIEEWENLKAEDGLFEEIMLGLRVCDGVPESLLRKRGDSLDELEKRGLLRRTEDRVLLTSRGMLLSNLVLMELLPV
jgi:oxygen-independent coproporphyrinogen-3 oxidase